MTDTSKSITALALGNPPHFRMLHPRKISEEGLRLEASWLNTDGTVEATSGSTTFLYQAIDERYGTGFWIIVYYSKNVTEANCAENEALEAASFLDLVTFQSKILPKINNFLPVTKVDIKTVNGSLLVSPIDPPEAMVYPLIPNTLATVHCVSISLLRKCPMQIFHSHVDLVTIDGDSDQTWYVFKRYSTPIDEDEPMDILLAEVEHLLGLRSPYIIRPAFLITDTSNSCFHGYLTLFMPAGTLTDVFDNLLADGTVDPMDPKIEDPVLLRPKLSQPSSPEAKICYEDASRKPFASKPKLNWALKHTWSIEATTGVATLHESGICSGDIKLDNILLGREGHLQLIDVAPQEGYTELYIPPEFDLLEIGSELPMTEARDIFALGIVLWQIAEEVGRFNREDQFASPCLVWTEGPESTPQWYKDLINSCVEADAEKRPTAGHVLEVLKASVVLNP